MMYKLLDTVVLDRDLPEHGLRNRDLGAVVQVYPVGDQFGPGSATRARCDVG